MASQPRSEEVPPERRERGVRMMLEQSGEAHGVITRVTRQLGVGTELLRNVKYNWVRQAEIDGGARHHHRGQGRITQLEKENRELRRANEMAVRWSGWARQRLVMAAASRSEVPIAGAVRCWATKAPSKPPEHQTLRRAGRPREQQSECAADTPES